MSQSPTGEAIGRTVRKGLPLAVGLGALALCTGASTPAQPAAAQPAVHTGEAASSTMPNIVILYADDLGYGDTSTYGATDLPTPNLDKLAKEGLRFTDVHSEAATCTPSRYSLLTGRYGFRANAKILPGNAPALIRPGTLTIASMLKTRGYRTAVVGKWHLGLGSGNVNWNKTINPGPREIGFDYSFIIPATPDRVPTVYVQNDRVVGLDPSDPLSISYKKRIGARPIGSRNPGLLRYKPDKQHSGTIIDGVSRIGYMKGGYGAEWVDENFHTILTNKAIGFIDKNQHHRFFLYFAMPEPHVPRLPGKPFQGATTLGPRGDAIVEMDWIVGKVMHELHRLHLDKNTLVIFSSDNGPVLNDGYVDGAVKLLGHHHPAGPFRGGKYSAYEGGSRMPTITWWPGHIKPGTVSNALISQTDFLASLAALTHVRLADNVAIDSRDVLPALLGKSPTARTFLVSQSTAGLGLRDGQLKYISPTDDMARAAFVKGKGIASGASLAPQLYNLADDIGERHNIARTHPATVARLQAVLDRVRARKTVTASQRKTAP